MGWSGFGVGLNGWFDLCLGCGFLVSLFVFLCLGESFVLVGEGRVFGCRATHVVILCMSREPTTNLRNLIKRHLSSVVVPDVRMLAHRAVDVAKSLEQSLRNGR